MKGDIIFYQRNGVDVRISRTTGARGSRGATPRVWLICVGNKAPFLRDSAIKIKTARERANQMADRFLLSTKVDTKQDLFWAGAP